MTVGPFDAHVPMKERDLVRTVGVDSYNHSFSATDDSEMGVYIIYAPSVLGTTLSKRLVSILSSNTRD